MKLWYPGYGNTCGEIFTYTRLARVSCFTSKFRKLILKIQDIIDFLFTLARKQPTVAVGDHPRCFGMYLRIRTDFYSSDWIGNRSWSSRTAGKPLSFRFLGSTPGFNTVKRTRKVELEKDTLLILYKKRRQLFLAQDSQPTTSI